LCLTNPPGRLRGICALQMALIYASPPLTAISGLAFIIDVHLRLTNALFTSKVDHKYTRSLIIIPWALFAAIASEALIAVRDFAEVQRDPNHMYCHSLTQVQTRISGIICVVGLGAALLLIIWTSVILYRNWVLFRHLSTTTSELRLSSLIRILVFTLQTSIGLGLGASAPETVTAKLAFWSALLPLLPVLCGIAFGTQRDMIRCWMFWKPQTRNLEFSPSESKHTREEEVV